MPSSLAYANINGTRLHYEMAGSGNVVVFIHGFGSDSRIWDSQFKVFAEKYLVIRYDIRGHGKSAVPGDESYSHADDLKALLDYLTISQASIIGQSYGGGIGIDFALAYPENTTNLVLVDSTLDGFQWSKEWHESWMPIYSLYATSGASAALPVLLVHPLFAPGFRQPTLKSNLTKILSEYSGWHIVNVDSVIERQPRSIEHLDQIQAQTLILIGEHDLPDFHTISEILADQIPHAEKMVFADAGHVLPMEAPEKFNALVMAFLENRK